MKFRTKIQENHDKQEKWAEISKMDFSSRMHSPTFEWKNQSHEYKMGVVALCWKM